MWENFFVSLGIRVKYFFDIYGYVFGAIFLEVFIAGAASQHTSRFIETGRNGCFKVNFINESDLLSPVDSTFLANLQSFEWNM